MFEVMVGSSARDIHLRGQFEWTGEDGAGGRRFHVGLSLGVLLRYEKSKAVLREHLGEFLDTPDLELGMNMSLQQLAEFAPEALRPEVLATINADLEAIEG